MESSEHSIEEIKKLWQQEPGEVVLKAVTEDKEEYPPEIQNIIQEEAVKRGLLEERRQESVFRNDDSQSKLTDDFINASSEIKEARFCPVCKEMWPISDKDLCSKCNVSLEHSGYCEDCDKFWAIPPGKLCPNHKTKLTERRLSLLQKFSSLVYSGVGLAFGYILVRYFGLLLSIPFLGFVLCLWIANKFLSPAKKAMLMAIAWHASFVLYFAVIGTLSGELRGPALLEFLFTLGALIWLIGRPSVGPVALLTILHILTLLMIALGIFFGLELESVNFTYKTLLYNLICRVPAIIFMYTGLRGIRRLRKPSGNVTTPVTVTSEQ